MGCDVYAWEFISHIFGLCVFLYVNEVLEQPNEFLVEFWRPHLGNKEIIYSNILKEFCNCDFLENNRVATTLEEGLGDAVDIGQSFLPIGFLSLLFLSRNFIFYFRLQLHLKYFVAWFKLIVDLSFIIHFWTFLQAK